MKPVIFTNGLIFGEGFRFVGSIVVEDGMIRHINYGEVDRKTIDPEAYDIVDCQGKMVLPGAIDEHVHFRDPGLTEKGDLMTESRAAVAGGVTSFFDMPNTLPATTSIEAWEAKMHRAREASAANYAFFLGATDDNLREILRSDTTRIPGVKLFLGASTGNMLVKDRGVIKELFAKYQGIICVHAECHDIIEANRRRLLAEHPEGIPLTLHSTLRSREACFEATRCAVELARKHDARLHVLHVSTAEELQFFSSAPLVTKRITAETCPHYLYFTDDELANGALTKCNPAIKKASDRDALLDALADGRIDTVGTDHAPHLAAQKQGDALTATSGLPSVQFALPLMLQLARRGNFSYETVVEKMCANPATLFGVSRRGFLRPNYWADIVVVDPDADYVITDADVLSGCGWTPYAGQHLNFRVLQTWVNGRIAYNYADAATPGRGICERHTALPIRFDPL